MGAARDAKPWCMSDSPVDLTKASASWGDRRPDPAVKMCRRLSFVSVLVGATLARLMCSLKTV